jgi:LacI family transcriptional regulator
MRILFLLPEGTNAYMRELADQVERQGRERIGVDARVETFPGLDPPALAARLAGLEGGVDAVALVALDHPVVRQAVTALVRAGTQVVTLASDIHNVPRLCYIGIDNGQAGRLAGYVLGRLLGAGRQAKIAVLAGSLGYRGHQEREMGFRQILAEDFPGLELVAIREIHEDREKDYRAVSDLVLAHPDLAGIYNVGGGTAGIARALEEQHRRDVVFVAHEATAQNRSFLLDGTLDAVIDQNPRVAVRETLDALTAAARGLQPRPVAPRVQIIFRENLPND